jgi:broad specificity phosphatase PhoE
LEEIQDIKDNIQNIVDLDNVKVFCSTSPRAKKTAENLFSKNKNIIKSDQFVEFDLSIFYIPFLKFGIRTWFLISRILWCVGILKTDRNFQQEKKRADSCAGILASNTEHTKVSLVAHGLLNLFIEKNLKKNGWKITHTYSSGCFSIKVMQNV